MVFSVPVHNTGGLTERYQRIAQTSNYMSGIFCFETLRAADSTKWSCVRDKGLLLFQRTQRASSTCGNVCNWCQYLVDRIICKLLCHTDPKCLEVYRDWPRFLDQVFFALPTRSGLGLFCDDHTLRENLRSKNTLKKTDHCKP